MRKLVAVIEAITNVVSGHLPAWTVFVLMVMVLFEVITRYVMQAPLSIADEMGGFMLVGITFLGLAYTWKERGHVSVEIVTNILPPKVKQWARFITLLMALVFCFPLIAAAMNCFRILYSLVQEAAVG